MKVGRDIDIIAHEAHMKIFDHAHFLLKPCLFCISDVHGHEFLGLYIVWKEQMISRVNVISRPKL